MRYTVVTVVVTLPGIEQRPRISLDMNNTQMPVPAYQNIPFTHIHNHGYLHLILLAAVTEYEV
jgi:hypothetical protein